MPLSSHPPIALLGAGSWGTALAIHLARCGNPVRLWGRNPDTMRAVKAAREHSRYLPGIPFPPGLTVFSDLSAALAGVRDAIIVVPSTAFADVLGRLLSVREPGALRLAWGTKGLDLAHRAPRFLHELVREKMGAQAPIAVLSGPSFANDVALGQPTAIVAASSSADFAHAMAARFHSPSFYVDCSSDMIGVQLAGVMKNIIAVCVGVLDGLAFGLNARGAVIARGMMEMATLGRAMGADSATFFGPRWCGRSCLDGFQSAVA